ncbi:MAG: hypothetical protein WC606_03610 [Candidatus Absconditabacterales bacterium]|jgi:hypothetical protein
MPTKKPVKKASVKSSVENKAKNFAKNFEKEARVIKSEGKEIGGKIGARREVSTTEEKIFTIIGILLLIFGLYVLRNMIGGMILIVLGILFVTGFFLRRKK